MRKHTSIPVPDVLAWNSDAFNDVGREYIIPEKAPGIQLYKKMGKHEWHLETRSRMKPGRLGETAGCHQFPGIRESLP